MNLICESCGQRGITPICNCGGTRVDPVCLDDPEDYDIDDGYPASFDIDEDEYD